MRVKEPEVAVVSSVDIAADERRLKVDESRKAVYRTVSTNIMTRAWSEAEGRVVSCDIAYLDRQSLLNWLSENQDRSLRAVLALLGHKLSE
ncbi:MAG: hypothetical protein WC565_02115 [Parcubacteria group bacterium]